METKIDWRAHPSLMQKSRVPEGLQTYCGDLGYVQVLYECIQVQDRDEQP